MVWIGKALFKLWPPPGISNSLHSIKEPYLVLSPAYILPLKKKKWDRSIWLSLWSIGLFPTIYLSESTPLVKNRRYKERSRYCAEVTEASILVCAACHFPARHLTSVLRLLNSIMFSPSNQTTLWRWGEAVALTPKGKLKYWKKLFLLYMTQWVSDPAECRQQQSQLQGTVQNVVVLFDNWGITFAGKVG